MWKKLWKNRASANAIPKSSPSERGFYASETLKMLDFKGLLRSPGTLEPGGHGSFEGETPERTAEPRRCGPEAP
jgi:hypothetical protein